MKRVIAAVLFLFISSSMPAQIPDIEEMTAIEDANLEDDDERIKLEALLEEGLNINTADENELRALPFLNSWQIQQLILYRALFGQLLHIYELQAVPGWTPVLIRKLQPYIKVQETFLLQARREKWWKAGKHNILLRWSKKYSSASSAKSTISDYRSMLRYRYSFRNRFQYGLVAEKDAGEPLFSKDRKAGFDFYSVHLFLKREHWLYLIALGDYSVRMGQGLIHWQGLSFGKTGDLARLKKQAPVIHPYQSAGEFHFHRGAAVGLKGKNWQAHVFYSLRKLSATVSRDSAGRMLSFSSFRPSGLHSTPGEMAGRNVLPQQTWGANFKFQRLKWQVSANLVSYNYEVPMQKERTAANFFAISGRRWFNASIDYSHTYKNWHFFGELATDMRKHAAVLAGALLSVAPRFDMGWVYRNFSVGYQSINGQALAETAMPGNERGLLWAIDWRLAQRVRLQGWVDRFMSPWIKTRIPRPQRGSEAQLLLTAIVSKQSEFTARWVIKGVQREDMSLMASGIVAKATSLRLHFATQINQLELRTRLEAKWVGVSEAGWLWYTELIFKVSSLPVKTSFRLQYFDTDSYSSRIYAYERDLLYTSTLSAFYGKGWLGYILWSARVGKRWQCWLKYAVVVKETSPLLLLGGLNNENQLVNQVSVQCLFSI